MTNATSAESLDQIFRSARTYNGWTDTPLGEGVVRGLYDLLKWGPTLRQLQSGTVCLGSQYRGQGKARWACV
jgi:hypothetical protein